MTGGGYLEFDNDNKRYAGILELAFGKIGLTAVGLITTRMPDGSKGFSMLVVIGVEFDPPITLPYNFNLSGVGGLLGIQRSMNVDYLREGLKQGTLDSVLFPQDPIANAARIISDLRAGFPPDKGRYLFGPMAIIGWGNPKIIRAEVGIFIELPKPVRVAILGQVTAQLPNAEADTETVVVIHLDILGVLDFEKKTFSLDAVIYDSRILQFSLSGDMAMRFSWGSPPFFLISFGGYNPKFKVQAGMPALRRMTLSLGKGSNPRLSLECYMAVTTNSLQFGAKLELLAKKSKFKVHGYLYFHALFIFSPFSFVIDMGAGVEVFAGGASLLSITLDFTLSGPTPWRAKGTGKFKILCVKVKIRFDVTWGRRGGRALPAMDPWEDLLAALNSPGNWKSLLPGESEQLVRLRKIEDAAGTVNVHSRGLSQISQTVLPFNEKLDKYGNHPIAGDTEYRVTEINDLPVEDANALRVAYTKEYYATGQSKKLSHSEKLSRPSFEEYDMNIVIGSERVTAGPARHCALAFETEVIDENRVASPLPRTGLPWRNAAAGLANRAGKNRGRDKYFNAAQKPLVGVLTERYHVTDKYSGRSVAAAADTFGGAKSVLEQYAHDNPETAGNVQIVTGYERMS
ncbi:MAG: hypothetical protein JXD23_02380 [Spirochaetales bacterium]|nr:hypothetical protein [Spirochaetales bacterium]